MFMNLKNSEQAQEIMEKRREMCEQAMDLCQKMTEEMISGEEEKQRD